MTTLQSASFTDLLAMRNFLGSDEQSGLREARMHENGQKVAMGHVLDEIFRRLGDVSFNR